MTEKLRESIRIKRKLEEKGISIAYMDTDTTRECIQFGFGVLLTHSNPPHFNKIEVVGCSDGVLSVDIERTTYTGLFGSAHKQEEVQSVMKSLGYQEGEKAKQQ